MNATCGLTLAGMTLDDLRSDNILPGLGEEQLRKIQYYAILHSKIAEEHTEQLQQLLERDHREIRRHSKPMAWMTFVIFRHLVRHGDVHNPQTLCELRAVLDLLIGFRMECRFMRNEVEAFAADLPSSALLSIVVVRYHSKFMEQIPTGRRRDTFGE